MPLETEALTGFLPKERIAEWGREFYTIGFVFAQEADRMEEVDEQLVGLCTKRQLRKRPKPESFDLHLKPLDLVDGRRGLQPR
jgi:hypothetical protein